MKFYLANRYLWLLLSLSLFFLVAPFLIDMGGTLVVFNIFFSVILFVSVYVITRNRFLITAGLILSSIIFLMLWVNNIFKLGYHFLGVEYSLIVVYFFMITVVLIHSVYREMDVSFNTICGALCGYLLIGLVWSFFYGLINFFQINAFNFPDVRYAVFDGNFHRYIYFSFVTLTTLGYGDITPVSSVARTFAWVEAMVGQIYLTVWLAQLVGIHIMSFSKKNH